MHDHEGMADDAPAATTKDREVRREAAFAAGGEAGDAVVAQTVTINRPAAELYAYWRDFANLATFMENVERVDVVDRDRSHWVVKSPGGTVEWDAIVTEDREGALIAWESAEGAEVRNAGRVTFQDAGSRGTWVTATIAYDPPGGAIGQFVAKLFQREPRIQARRELRRFKQLMETGEVATNAMNLAQKQEEDA